MSGHEWTLITRDWLLYLMRLEPSATERWWVLNQAWYEVERLAHVLLGWPEGAA